MSQLDLVSFSCRFELPPAVYTGPPSRSNVNSYVTTNVYYVTFRYPYTWCSRVFQSCLFHPCDLVPCFPVLPFPVPRFQRPRRLAAYVSVRVSVISELIPISTLVYMLLIAIFSSPSPTRIDCGWHILNEVVFITTSMLLLLNCLN